MTTRVSIDESGGVFLPRELCGSLGAAPGDVLVVSLVDGLAILSREGDRPELEDYTEERIAEFASDDAKVRQILSRSG